MKTTAMHIPRELVEDFCRRHHLRRLALFGSVLRDDFTPESDVDVLVEFLPGHVVGIYRFMGMQHELSDLLGLKVQLTTPRSLSPLLHDEILAEALTLYEAPR